MPNAVCRRGGYISNAMQTPNKRKIIKIENATPSKSPMIKCCPDAVGASCSSKATIERR